MNKAISIFFILCGLGIAGMWIMSMISGQIPELKTEPISIILHITAEYLLAISSFITGIGILLKKKWANTLIFFTIGMLLCSVVNAGFYYMTRYFDVAMLIMFSVIACISFVILFYRGKNHDKKKLLLLLSQGIAVYALLLSAGIWGYRGEWGLFGMIIIGTFGIGFSVIHLLKPRSKRD